MDGEALVVGGFIVLGLLLCALTVVAAVLWTKGRASMESAELARKELATLSARFEAMNAENATLSKYRTVVDAEARAREILQQVAHESEAKRKEASALAQNLKATAAQDAQEITRQANANHANLTHQANDTLIQARASAEQIVVSARTMANEFTEEAQKLKADIAALERTAQAMKNVVEGYGDAYIVPSLSVLDTLAEQYGFEQAGAELKAVRERARDMARTGQAATCEYKEAIRRQTAVDFVLDAFNGKADSILADVRHDNWGTLQQKLKDAFMLVNANGKAFRDARITDEYLQARLSELQWASAVHQLKLRDKEEQRLLKERMREEERAQREFEKAQKEALKEEDTIRKAMEKAQKEIDRASLEQRSMYEEQLRALALRLQEAEEKNKRALSMAQQTKTGHVYVISNVGSFGEDVYKIGLTRRLEPLDRIKELGDASVPFEFDVHALIQSSDAPALEYAMHKRFVTRQVNKVNPRKEFFRLSLEEVRKFAEQEGLQATWTMSAACREWKETQALEKSMSTGQTDVSEWVERQEKVLSEPPPRELALAEEEA
jgi:hypothetical protein